MDDDVADIRAGEEIDKTALTEFLLTGLGREVADLRILQFPAGSSNLTYSVLFDGSDYVLRRPPFGSKVKIRSRHVTGV